MDDRLPMGIDIALSGLVAGQSIRIAINTQSPSESGKVGVTNVHADSLVAAAAVGSFGPLSASNSRFTSGATALGSEDAVPNLKGDTIYRCVLSSPSAGPSRWRWFGLRTASKWSRRVSSLCEIYPTLRDVSSSLLAACAATIAITW